MKYNKIAFIAVLALSTAISAFAQKEGTERGQNKNRMTKEWTGKADRMAPMFNKQLTEEQKSSIKEIRINSQKTAKPLRFKLKELKARQQTLINEDKPNMTAINSNIDEMTKIENQLAKIKAKARIDVLSQLTDEQKLLFSEKKKGNRSKSFGNRMPGRSLAPRI